MQFTSPIRRYADLLVHYQLKAHLHGRKPYFSNEQLAGTALTKADVLRQASQVSRKTVRYWVLEYLRRHVGTTYEATVVAPYDYRRKLYQVYLPALGAELAYDSDTDLFALGDVVFLCVAAASPRDNSVTFRRAALGVRSAPAKSTAAAELPASLLEEEEGAAAAAAEEGGGGGGEAEDEVAVLEVGRQLMRMRRLGRQRWRSGRDGADDGEEADDPGSTDPDDLWDSEEEGYDDAAGWELAPEP